MTRIAVGLIALTTLLTAPGCLTSTQATRLQTDLDEARRQIFAIQQDTAASRARVEEIDKRLAGPETSAGNQAEMRSLMQSLLDQIQALGEEIRLVKAKMASLQQELQSARSPAPRSAAPSPAASAPDAQARAAAEEAYKAAYTDYTRGSFDLAAGEFETFLKSWPEHPMAPDAQYWIGECLFSQKKFAEAAEAFDRTVTRWPGCERTAAALLKKGLAQIEAGDSAQAVSTFQSLIAKAPGSNEAQVAADRLKQMGLRGAK